MEIHVLTHINPYCSSIDLIPEGKRLLTRSFLLLPAGCSFVMKDEKSNCVTRLVASAAKSHSLFLSQICVSVVGFSCTDYRVAKL